MVEGRGGLLQRFRGGGGRVEGVEVCGLRDCFLQRFKGLFFRLFVQVVIMNLILVRNPGHEDVLTTRK